MAEGVIFLQVSDFMIRDVVYAHSGEPVRDLLARLVEHRIGGVPVLNDDNKIVGMVSDGDILRALAPQEATIFNLYTMVFAVEKQEMQESVKQQLAHSVDDIMTQRRLYYVHPDDDIEQVMKVLSKHLLKKIPVIDEHENVCGVISRGDVIRYITTHMIDES